MMIVALHYEISCFSNDAKLVGNGLDKSFTLHLYDASDLDSTCLSSKSKPAKVRLLFPHNANTIYISANFDYSNATGPYAIEYSNVDAIEPCLNDGSTTCTPYTQISTSLFDYLEEEGIVSYIALLLDSVPNPGGLNDIRNTKMNTTNCWGSISMKYDLSFGHETIAVVGEPLDCKIASPKVEFQFKHRGAWESFLIDGDASYNSSCYCSGRGSYNFQSINYYIQELSTITDLTEIAEFNLFLAAFESDLALETRLVILTPVDGSTTMFETVISEIEEHNALNDKCLTGMTPQVYVDPRAVYLRAAPRMYAPPDCESNSAKIVVMIELYNGTSVFALEQITYSRQEFLSRLVHIFEDPRAAELNAGKFYTHYYAVLQAYDENNRILMGSSIRDVIRYTCLEFAQFYLAGQELCVDLALKDEERCVFEAETTAAVYIGFEPAGYTSMATYLSYMLNISFTTERKRFCSSTPTEQFLNQMAPGDIKRRTKEIKRLAAQSLDKVVVEYVQSQECIYSNLLIVDDSKLLTIIMVVVACAFGIGALATSVYLVVKEAQM